MKFNLLHPADQLVMIMERIYGYGMTTTSGGNLSIMDENGDIWITPSGVDKGSLTAKDIMQIKPDGTIIGNHKPSVEFPFHQQVYATRKDIKAVLHAHPPALIAFSLVRKAPNTKLIPNAHLVCGEIGMAEYAVPGSTLLGEKIVTEFEKGYHTVMLENHGVVVGGESLFHAFMIFETLEFCARLEINAKRMGNPITLNEKHLDIQKNKQHIQMNEFIPNNYSSIEKGMRKEMCKLIHRSYNQQLFTSTQGTFSQRLDDDTFIITPYMVDRKYIEPADIVSIENGLREAYKTPSRSVMLHQAIYEKHPDIHSVIIAHPPNVMAFAVTTACFDSKTIPESYIMLRDVQKLPFGSSFMQPQMVADAFSKTTPIVMIENDAIIVTGSSLLNAFDRLEVAEYSAKAIIASKDLGDIIKISDAQVTEIEEVFNL